jgi:hypothetical protein
VLGRELVKAFVSINWRGLALTDLRTVVELIGVATTKTGLNVQAPLRPELVPAGEKISDADFAAIPLTAHEWHGEWNYTIAQSNPR